MRINYVINSSCIDFNLAFYIGYSRGIILQTYYFIASIVSLVIASQFYQTLAEKITLWIPILMLVREQR